jgi:hypothetical protein
MSRRPAWFLLAALALPIVWLGGSAAVQEHALGSARDWRIPIEDYDPRDPLRGQYVRFTYGWALAGTPGICLREGCRLCLSNDGGSVTATALPRQASCRFPVDLAASSIGVQPGFAGEAEARFTSRIFVSEATAPAIEAQLRDGPMVVVAALTPDGRLINRRIEPAG